MKQTIVSLIVLTLMLSCSSISTAEDTILTPTASASSYYYFYYTPDKAIDNDESTYWVGDINKSPWWIALDTGNVSYIAKINMKWLAPYYAPLNYDIQISSDGVTWESVYSGTQDLYNAQGDTRDINKIGRYIRLYIRQVQYCFPVLKEVKVYGRKNIPRLMRFQGSLNDADGLPLEGSFNLTFRIYDAETGGTALWRETQSSVNIEEGLLNVELGSVTPLNLPFDKQYWLSIQVGANSETMPRFRFTGVPYSFSLQ